MKNLRILAFVPIACLIMSCSTDPDLSGSGTPFTETRTVQDFTKVSSEGIFNVNIYQGSTQILEITADDNLMERIETNIDDGQLYLSLADNTDVNINPEVNITIPDLDGLTNSGVGEMNVFNFDCKQKIEIDNSGAGKIDLSGKSENLILKNEGTGVINGFLFTTSNASVYMKGAGESNVHCSGTMGVKIEGSAKVFYKGNPTLSIDVSGSGSVINAN